MFRSLLVVAAGIVGLVAVSSAAAHVIATPGFIASGSSASITFSAPNERDDPMTSFTLTAPDGLDIRHAHRVDGWTESLVGSMAIWAAGSLPSKQEALFGATIEATADPGIVELQAEQRYDDGGIVTWPVSITITPATETPSENLALAGVVGLIGVLVVVAVVMLAWRRRTGGDASS